MREIGFQNHLDRVKGLATAIIMLCVLFVYSSLSMAQKQRVEDLKYGAILYEFYQQRYFETLVEYEYAAERGGIRNHGDYPELLKGGVSLSYGLERQAKEIFSALIAENSSGETQSRAWYYLAKMLYLRGDVERAAETLSRIQTAMPGDIDQEYRYLAALINIKLGYFDAAEQISLSFDEDSPYAPYLNFNLGVALGKKNEVTRSVETLMKSVAYADGSEDLKRLADRAHMAMAYLNAENSKFKDAYSEIRQVSSSGVFSNRALLGSGWASVNNGEYREALTPLVALQKRSMALPEVQEAVLLVPHVYEKLGLPGRAAKGFISAYHRYGDALSELNKARDTLKDADVLELFVKNIDQLLGESDWFGTAPDVSLNPLSPYLLDLMSDHSFQSVLKELRDLYAIRNNLEGWKRKQSDFDVIINARRKSPSVKIKLKDIAKFEEEKGKLDLRYRDLIEREVNLEETDRKQIAWLINDLEYEMASADTMLAQLHHAEGVGSKTNGYKKKINKLMAVLDKELEQTNQLIGQVEMVLLELVNAELLMHEERIKYYRVQSHLAKVRILDRSLVDQEVQEEEDRVDSTGKEIKSLSDSERQVGAEEWDNAS